MFDSVQKKESRWKGLWPDLDDMDSAKAASRQGMWAALFITVVTSVAAWFRILGVDRGALLDAGVFALVAFGMFWVSRFAATAGLVLFVLERIAMLVMGQGAGGIVGIFLLLAFCNGVRGAFAYHRLRKQAIDVTGVFG
jgi:hypothetical protein